MKRTTLVSLFLVMVLALISTLPVLADSGSPIPIPPRTTTPVPPPDLQQKLQSTVKGGGYAGDVKLEFVTIKVDQPVVRVGDIVNVQMGIYPLDPRLTPATVTVVTDEYWQSTTLYGPSTNVNVTWMKPGTKTISVYVQANGGTMQSNTINVLVKPEPLVISMADSGVICVKGYSCGFGIKTNRPINADDLVQGPIRAALVFWWPNQYSTFGLVTISEQFAKYYFEYSDSAFGNTGFWVDLWTYSGYSGNTYVSMIEPAPIPTPTQDIIPKK